MLYEISLTAPGYDGTLQVLIEVVRRHEVNIVDVSLAPIARQVAFAVLENEKMDFSPCTAVAGLMFLKSRALLPWKDNLEEPELEDISAPLEEEEEPTQVRERLLALYEVFQEAAEQFRTRANDMQDRIRAAQTRAQHSPSFLDEITFVDTITAYDLLIVMNQVLKRAAEAPKTYRVAVDDSYILNQRIAEVFSFLIKRGGTESRFSEIISGPTPKKEAVITFLAIVYLVSQGRIYARQKLPYGEIIMTARTANGSEQPT